jgi:hypothetical protein
MTGQLPKIGAVKSAGIAGSDARHRREKGRALARSARGFRLGSRDASLLKRDGLPLAAFFHVDTGEHYLAGRIFPS